MAFLDPYANQYNCQQSQSGLSGYGIAGAYGLTGTTAPYISTILSPVSSDFVFNAKPAPPTAVEWLDRRIDEIRVKL